MKPLASLKMYISCNNMHGSCICTKTKCHAYHIDMWKTTFFLVHKQLYLSFFKHLSCHVSLCKYLALWNKTKSLDFLYTHNRKNDTNIASYPKAELNLQENRTYPNHQNIYHLTTIIIVYHYWKTLYQAQTLGTDMLEQYQIGNMGATLIWWFDDICVFICRWYDDSTQPIRRVNCSLTYDHHAFG